MTGRQPDMRLPLKPPKPFPRTDNGHTDVAWKSSLPFNVNPRGVLIHRVKSGRTHFQRGEYSHHTVEYWCGGSAHTEGMDLTNCPPVERLLCVRCEMFAVAAGLPAADAIAGYHIHLGTLKAHRECCRNDQN